MRTRPLMVGHPEFLDMGRGGLAAGRAPPPPARWSRTRSSARVEPVGLDRLHQIVDRGDVERGDREIVEGGDEDDRRIDRRSGRARGRRRSRPCRAWRCRAARRSGATASAMRSAASPSLAVPTTVTPSQRASSSCSRSTASGSSSTTMTRSVAGLSHSRTTGMIDVDGKAAVGIGAVEAAGADAVAGGQPVADIPEADAGAAIAAVRRLASPSSLTLMWSRPASS